MKGRTETTFKDTGGAVASSRVSNDGDVLGLGFLDKVVPDVERVL